MTGVEQSIAELDSPIADASQSGGGYVTVERSGRRSAVVRALARSPLKLLTPQVDRSCAWIFSSTYGGGLVGGDSIQLHVDAGEETRTLLSTQASTKVYRSSGAVSVQELEVNIARGAIVVSAPDPIVCFAGASFVQRQKFNLAEDAGLVMIDWMTSGRRARGERWAFDLYSSQTYATAARRCVFNETLRLDPVDGPINSPMRMGLIDCFATVLLLGKPLIPSAVSLEEKLNARPSPDAGLLFSISPIEQGAVLRIAGQRTETVGQWIREQFQFIRELVGQDPWERKW